MKICLTCANVLPSKTWLCTACGYEPLRENNVICHAAELAHGGGGFKAEYFTELSQLESANFWFRARNQLITWALKKYKPDAENFLEVGCGTGFVLSGIAKSFPNISLSGSEIFIAGLAHASNRVPQANLMQMDARRVPFVEDFDTIGAFDVLEHIEEDTTVLNQLYRALKPEGVLLLTVPQHPSLWSIADDYAYHVRRYTGKEIEAKIVNSGFEILKSTSFVTSLLPAMVISRLVQNKNIEKFNPANELKINPFINKIFYSLMVSELTGIKLGLSYPIGGSRLIVAKK